VPVPLSIVTVALAPAGVPVTALTEHAPEPFIVGITEAFVVAVTVNVELYGALAGAPVKVTVGAGGGKTVKFAAPLVVPDIAMIVTEP
jgi:hypothetical protein